MIDLPLNGIEGGLVVVAFAHALVTGNVIGVFLLFVASQTVLPALRGDDE